MITDKDLDRSFPSEFLGDIFYIRFIRNTLKRFRIWMVKRHIKAMPVHVDLGCGDASLLKVSPCNEKIGLDTLHGDLVRDKLDLPDEYADYITMLAFIEHLEKPEPVLRECCRVLKKEGLLIITTPLKSSEKFLRLWHRDLDSEHKQYYDGESMEIILHPCFRIELYKRFFHNQLFICRKLP